MKRFYVLFLGILSLFVLSASAKKWTPETLPMVHLQDAHRYVCNPDEVLHPSTVDSVDALLFALERDKGVETVVVVVSAQGDTTDDLIEKAKEIFERIFWNWVEEETSCIYSPEPADYDVNTWEELLTICWEDGMNWDEVVRCEKIEYEEDKIRA